MRLACQDRAFGERPSADGRPRYVLEISPVTQTVDTRSRGDGSRMSSPRSWSMPSALRFRDR